MKNLRAYFIISLVLCICIMSLVLYVCISPKTSAASVAGQENSLLRVYEVNKRVCDFPDKEDFSTPETAYAVINRVLAGGDQSAWQRISVKKLAERLPPADAERIDVKPETARQWLNARIFEVRIFRGFHAAVIAEISREGKRSYFDKRTVELENGRWLNAGQSLFRSLTEARAHFAASCASYSKRPVRPKVRDPDSYLKPFVQFLKNNAEEPKAFVRKALAKYKVVIMGEIHHRPRYWAFNSSLVTEQDFPKYVGTIYLELPSNDQGLVDKFLAAEECNTAPVIEMLRDNLWMGWPDRAMLDFFIAVWRVNQNLEPQHRIGIVLVDMQRPWKKIKKRQDWNRYNVDRDRFMAENILKDMRRHIEEKRNALFIVGVGHTALNLKFFEGSPLTTAGWYLQEELGQNRVYAIFQHRPVQTNMGRVDGRLCLGLFDSAFAAVGNKEMAFRLDVGPFGEQPYDADPERPVSSSYRDGFNAYLYLGPLETEIFSPLIAGFYTDEFVKELDRRHRMMFGRGWAESYRRDEMDAESFIAWMGNNWGKPRRGWHQKNLGPINAWHRGGRDWKQAIQDEKLAQVMEHPEEIVQAAKQLFENIRDADYDDFLTSKNKWNEFPTSGRYMAHHWHDKLVEWICKTFKDNPIVSIELGEVFIGDKEIIGKKGWPTVPYKLTLQDGTVLDGDLPFEYNSDGGKGHWHGMEGIDWHLQSKKT